jgi:hypothetical protein
VPTVITNIPPLFANVTTSTSNAINTINESHEPTPVTTAKDTSTMSSTSASPSVVNSEGTGVSVIEDLLEFVVLGVSAVLMFF